MWRTGLHNRLSLSLLVLFSCITVPLLLPSTADAAEYSSIGGRPANPDPKNPRSKSIFIHTIKPGQKVRDAVKVVNYTNETKTLEIYATDSLISSGGAFGCAQKIEKKEAVGSWIQLDLNEVTLKPNAEQVVKFVVAAPATANVGSNDGCIVIQEKNGKPQNISQSGGGSVALSFRTAIRVALTVPGVIEKRVSVIDYRSIPQKNGNTILQSQLKNEGNVSVDVDLTMFTENIFSLQKKQINQEFPILRGAITEWNKEFERPFWGGFITSSFIANYDSNPANTIGQKDNAVIKSVRSKTIRFISWPHPIALAIEIGVLLAALYSVVRVRKKWKERAWIKSSWITYTVKPGDSINSLASTHAVSWKLLAKTNTIKPPYTLEPGTKIKIPPKI